MPGLSAPCPNKLQFTINCLFADFNSPVKRDQVVALIDPAIYAAQVKQAKAQLMMAEVQLEEKQKDIEAAEAAVQSAEAHLASSRATLKDAELTYNRLSVLGSGCGTNRSGNAPIPDSLHHRRRPCPHAGGSGCE